MPKATLKWGSWNAICDICGFRFKSDELTKDWQGLMVCKTDYELRNPQDFLRVRPDNPAVPWSRPEGEDEFVGPACWIWDQSAYADLGTADCMKADNVPMSYIDLYTLKWGYPPPYVTPTTTISGIPGYAIPGLGIPGVTFTGVSF